MGVARSCRAEDLVAAALRLGPDRLALQDIANELGVTRTSLYYDVRDQAELGRLVLSELIDKTHESHQLPLSDATWEVWLEALGEGTAVSTTGSGAVAPVRERRIRS